jgi:tRNA (Thr-GGU) A37 N-methylase
LAWPIEPIGVVRSDRVDLDHTPVQAGLNPREIARAVLDDRYADALDGLADFSHIWLVTWLGDPTTASGSQFPHAKCPSCSDRRDPRLASSRRVDLGVPTRSA